MNIQRLNRNNVSTIAVKVEPPQYDISKRRASIVHIGIGAFHKAHQATFTDDIMAKTDGNYGIIGVSLRSPGARDRLAEQDYLYTSVEKSAGKQRARIISAIQQVLVAPEDPQQVIDTLADDAINVVMSTITEKGYCLLPGNIGLDLNHVDIVHDLHNLDSPKSMIGYVVKACQIRMEKGHKGFAFVSCDNLPDNSQIAGKAIIEFADQIDAQLASWIKSNLSFCNSMVDRIVPAVTEQDLQQFSDLYGYQDQALVTSEPFRQWVIEDNFKTPRPPWDLAGAMFVNDVAAYEKMKLRFLNGSHSALAYLGKVSGYSYIHEAVAEPTLKALVAELMAEMTVTLTGTMDFDFASYGQVIVERFENDQIQYQTQQVATDGSQKLPQRILAPLNELLIEHGRVSKALCIVLAGWVRYLSGRSEQGELHEINDPMAATLSAIFQHEDSTMVEKLDQLFAIDGLLPEAVKTSEAVKELILHLTESFETIGVIATIQRELNDS